MRPSFSYRAGRAEDVSRLEELLRAAHLPANRILEIIDDFVVAESEGVVAGGGAIEVYGDTALLRSVVIDEGLRGRGIGLEVATRLVANAIEAGATDLYLYTYTSGPFWEKLGFAVLADSEWREPVRASWQWQYVTAHAEQFARDGLHAMWRPI